MRDLLFTYSYPAGACLFHGGQAEYSGSLSPLHQPDAAYIHQNCPSLPLCLSYHAYMHGCHRGILLPPYIHCPLSAILVPCEISSSLSRPGHQSLDYDDTCRITTWINSTTELRQGMPFPGYLIHSSCGIITVLNHPKSLPKRRRRPSYSDPAAAWA